MLKQLFFTLWFFLPAGVANMMPIFAVHIPQLKRFDTPMDFGKSFRGKRIFGSHKTWRGLIAGAIFSTLTLWLQQLIMQHTHALHAWTEGVSYANIPTLLLGPLFAVGALGGDAIESFFKRQRNLAPGKGWFPFDQTDYIIGAALVSTPFVSLSLLEYIALVIMWLIIHLVASALGYFMGVKESPI